MKYFLQIKKFLDKITKNLKEQSWMKTKKRLLI